MVDHLTARGYRAGCEALLHDDARGTQVELRLPAGPTTAGIPVTQPPAIQPSATAPTPTTIAPHVVPRPRPPAPTIAIPHPPTTVTTIPPAPERRRSHRALWVTAAVIGTLTVASALGNASRDDPPATVSPLPTAAAAPPTYSPALLPAPVSSPTPADDTVDEPVTRASATTSRPAPRTVQAAPKPAPTAEPKQEPSGCDPNYSGCVPIARDVDCAGGRGDGPAYVKGPVRVIGKDIYGLDRGGEPGVGCE